MHAGLDVLAPLYVPKTDVGVQFTEIRQKEGLRAALTWRRDQIKQYEDLRTCVKRQIGRFQKRYWAYVPANHYVVDEMLDIKNKS